MGSEQPLSDNADLVARVHREQWGRVLAAVARSCGDLELAQDCTQRAFERALTEWRTDVPDSQPAWLISVAKRFAIDEHRHQEVVRRKAPLLIMDESGAGDDGPDLLRLVFCCCHPVLDRTSQVALTLRLVCGVPTEEVAQALLVRRPAVAARITRAKQKIAQARVPYRIPARADLADRLDVVLDVIHLVATVAHERSRTDTDSDLTERAWILARGLVELLPDDAEPRGLLALIVLNAARADARRDTEGEILLGDQDRARWDPRGIRAGLSLATAALNRGMEQDRPGRFALQAGIVGLHAQAASLDETDWPAIVRLYERLLERWATPVVRLNHAIARSYIDGPGVALALVDELTSEPALLGYPYLHAARGKLLADLGRIDEARTAYRSALSVAIDDEQRRFLRGRIGDPGGR